ncbi:MAG: TonB-dependent receptor [Parvularculaceae bacterium]
MKFKSILAAGSAAMAVATAIAVSTTPAMAQQTDASIRGTVVDANGAPVSGAQVTITHKPSGTSGSASTTGTGTFFEGGLRVGGPYSVTITAPGYEPQTVEGVYLDPGETERLVVNLAELAATDEILVIGRRSEQLDLNGGAGSSFDKETIQDQPAVSRDIIQTLLRDPLVNTQDGKTAISVAGVNPRYNALAVNGVLQQDDFGLSNSLYPTSRSTISLDAVEVASVVASDYSVKSSGFQGGLVNVVTKSGSNDLTGTAYWYRSGQNFLGELSDGTSVPASEFKEREYGATLGGPIIRDKLFFFVAYEDFKTSAPVNFAGNDASNLITNADGFFSKLNADILTGTGFDAGGRPSSTATPETSKRWIGKIDWNITDDHRMEASYQRSRETGTSVSSLSLTSAWYDIPQELDVYSGGIYSDWTDSFSTTLRVGYKEYTKGQICRAPSDFGEIQMRFTGAELIAAGYDGLVDPLMPEKTFVAGCDRFRHGNTFDDNRLQIFASGDYEWQDHVTTFGGEYEKYALNNLFLSDSNGTFVYDDINELLTGNDVTVTYRNVVSNDKADAITSLSYKKMSLFAQDEWQVLPNLSLNAGVRYERYFQGGSPPERADFLAAYGRTNTNDLGGIDIIQPRFGFRYEPFERTTITGGFGLYSGGNPMVWISNAFQPQIFQVSGTYNGVNPGVIPSDLIDAIAASDPTTPTFIDTISPDFKIPSQWKGSVRVAQTFDLDFGGINLGSDYLFAVQYLYSKVKDDFVWRNLAQTDLGLPVGVAPDGRPIYSELQALGVHNAIELGNVSGGRSHVITAQLAKRYENGFNFDVSYAFQDVDSATEGTSSRAVSNWRSLVTYDRNNIGVGTAPYETRHAFNMNFGFEKEIFDGLTSRFDLFGIIKSGDPFSYVFDVSSSNALFGRAGDFESPYDDDLLYVPTMSGGASTDAAVVFASGFDGAGFESFMNQHGVTQGQIFDKNSVRGSWDQLWNFRFQQDMPFVGDFGVKALEGNRMKFTVDIFNVANLFNDKWGARYFAPSFDTEGVVVADIVSAADVALNGVDGATALTGNAPATTCVNEGDCVYRFNSFIKQPSSFPSLADSVYKIRVGLRYEF